MNQERKNEKGFTMVELIIVVAIMGIIGALLVPAYATMTTKARLTTDINTVKTLKRTAASFKAEKGTYPTSTDIAKLGDELKKAEYLDDVPTLQTPGAEIAVTPASGSTPYDIKLDLSAATDTSVSKALGQMSDDAKAWVSGVTPAASPSPTSSPS